MTSMSMRRLLAALILPVLLHAAGYCAQKPEARSSGWVRLFNGKDLSGWEKAGPGGNWGNENGVVYARRELPDTGMSWLVSRREYGDFILRLKFKANSDRFISGILIRDPGHAKIFSPAYNGFEVVMGHIPKQPEGDYHWNPGAIWELANAYYLAMPADKWTDIEIRCIGDHIVTFFNGRKMAETHSRRSYTGAIGFHLHGGKDKVDFQFKDVEIKELKPASRPDHLLEERWEQASGEFVPVLPNTLDGLTTVAGNAKQWSLDNGVLRADGSMGETLALAQKVYSNFELSFEFRLTSGKDAGILVRVPESHGAAAPGEPGYEFHITNVDNNAPNPTGSLFNLARGSDKDWVDRPIYRPGTWNRGRVYAEGDHLVTFVNLAKTAEVHSDASMRGRIGFRAAPGTTVEFRNVAIKPITKSGMASGK